MSEMSQILSRIETGDPMAAEQLLPLVYDELRKLAAAKLASEKPGQTLQPTALVHEAYLRLVGDGDVAQWSSRGHFFKAAAESIRRILIETARRKQSLKHGGNLARHELEEIPLPELHEDVLALDEALQKLSTVNRSAADLVQLRYFAGMTLPEASQVLDISQRTAGRLWTYARAWLRRELDEVGQAAEDL